MHTLQHQCDLSPLCSLPAVYMITLAVNHQHYSCKPLLELVHIMQCSNAGLLHELALSSEVFTEVRLKACYDRSI